MQGIKEQKLLLNNKIFYLENIYIYILSRKNR